MKYLPIRLMVDKRAIKNVTSFPILGAFCICKNKWWNRILYTNFTFSKHPRYFRIFRIVTIQLFWHETLTYYYMRRRLGINRRFATISDCYLKVNLQYRIDCRDFSRFCSSFTNKDHFTFYLPVQKRSQWHIFEQEYSFYSSLNKEKVGSITVAYFGVRDVVLLFRFKATSVLCLKSSL